MSAFGNDAVVFQIRAGRDQLINDLQASEKDIAASAGRTKGEVEQIFNQPPTKIEVGLQTSDALDDLEALRIKIDETKHINMLLDIDNSNMDAIEADITDLRDQIKADPFNVAAEIDREGIDKSMSAMLEHLQKEADSHVIRVKMQTEMEQSVDGGILDPVAEARERFKSTGPKASADADGGLGGMIQGAGKVNQIMGSVGRVMGQITAGIQVAALATDAWEIGAAAVSGEFERQVDAAKAAENTIKGIPLVGEKIVSLGALINRFTIDLVTGERAYVEELKKATIEQEKHTELMAKRLAHQKEGIAQAQQLLPSFNATVDPLKNVTSVGPERDPLLSAERQRTMDREKQDAALKEVLSQPGMRDTKGNLTGTGQDAQAEFNRLRQNDSQQVYDNEQQIADRAYTEIEANRLRLAGDTMAAERAEFLQTQREREDSAKKVSQVELQGVQEVNKAALALFDQRQQQEREAITRDSEFRVRQLQLGSQRRGFEAQQEAVVHGAEQRMVGQTPERQEQIAAERDAQLQANLEDRKRQQLEKTFSYSATLVENHYRRLGQFYREDEAAFEAALAKRVRDAEGEDAKRTVLAEGAQERETRKIDRARETQDINFDTIQSRRRRSGQEEEADIADITRDAAKDIRANAGDDDRIKAIIARTEEELRTRTADPGVGRVVSAQSTDLTGRFSTEDPNRELLSVEKQALVKLGEIAAAISKPPTAVAGP